MSQIHRESDAAQLVVSFVWALWDHGLPQAKGAGGTNAQNGCTEEAGIKQLIPEVCATKRWLRLWPCVAPGGRRAKSLQAKGPRATSPAS